MIGAVGAAVDDQTGDLKVCSGIRWQSHRLARQYVLSERHAHRQASAYGGVAIIAAAAVAAARPGMLNFSRDGHLCRHQAPLDGHQAHPERQKERQEQNSGPISTRGIHDNPAWRGSTPTARISSSREFSMRARQPDVMIADVPSLVLFAVLPTKIDAAFAGRALRYGGVSIAASLVWLWLIESVQPDRWDVTGAKSAWARRR